MIVLIRLLSLTEPRSDGLFCTCQNRPVGREGSMSYFLFGEFVFHRHLNQDELEDFAFTAVSLAASRRLGLQMGHATAWQTYGR